MGYKAKSLRNIRKQMVKYQGGQKALARANLMAQQNLPGHGRLARAAWKRIEKGEKFVRKQKSATARVRASKASKRSSGGRVWVKGHWRAR